MRSLLGALVNRAQISYAGRGDDRRMLGGMWGRSGPIGQMNAMGASATLYSVVNRMATATAKQEWHMHAPAAAGQACEYGQGTEDECGEVGVQLVDRHPALVVIGKPNPFYTRQELFESGQQHADLTGEGWLVVSYIGRIPAELWVARPDRMVVVTDPRDYLLGYIYVGPDGREQPLRARDVLSMRTPNPMDPYRGLGAVQTIMAQVSGASLSAEWNANFFRNGARPGGIVKLSRRMNDKEFERLVERFNIAHRGVANAGKTAFLEEGEWVDVKPMSVADMQFVETANLNRDTILLAFGASKYDVGVLEDVNRASATAASNDFAERLTVPRLDRWQGMFNNDLLPLFPGAVEQGLRLVYSSPLKRERAEKRADALTAAQVFEILTSVPGVDPLWAAEVAGLPEPVLKAVEPSPARVPSTVGEPLPEDAQNRARELLARFQAA